MWGPRPSLPPCVRARAGRGGIDPPPPHRFPPGIGARSRRGRGARAQAAHVPRRPWAPSKSGATSGASSGAKTIAAGHTLSKSSPGRKAVPVLAFRPKCAAGQGLAKTAPRGHIAPGSEVVVEDLDDHRCLSVNGRSAPCRGAPGQSGQGDEVGRSRMAAMRQVPLRGMSV